jgi:hypothetical protein
MAQKSQGKRKKGIVVWVRGETDSGFSEVCAGAKRPSIRKEGWGFTSPGIDSRRDPARICTRHLVRAGMKREREPGKMKQIRVIVEEL